MRLFYPTSLPIATNISKNFTLCLCHSVIARSEATRQSHPSFPSPCHSRSSYVIPVPLYVIPVQAGIHLFFSLPLEEVFSLALEG